MKLHYRRRQGGYILASVCLLVGLSVSGLLKKLRMNFHEILTGYSHNQKRVIKDLCYLDRDTNPGKCFYFFNIACVKFRYNWAYVAMRKALKSQ